MAENDNGLLDLATSLGFPKTYLRFVERGSEDDEEKIAKMLGMMGAMLSVMQAHAYACNERQATIAEVDGFVGVFEKSVKGEADSDVKAYVGACADAMRESARTIDAMQRGLIKKAGVDGEIRNGLQLNVPKLARFLASAMLSHASDDELIKLKRSGEPHPKVYELVTKALLGAYVFPITQPVMDVIRVHAAAACRMETNALFMVRGLKLSSPEPIEEPKTD